MKLSNEQKLDEKLNMFIDDAKKLFGADDESMLDEWEAAELEWEQEKLDCPEEARKVEMEADAGFERVMRRIEQEEAEGKEALLETEEIPDEEADSKNRMVVDEEYAADRKVIPISAQTKAVYLRGTKKALLLVAVVSVMVLGMTMGVTATSKYGLKQYLIPDKQTRIMRQNTSVPIVKVGRLEEAYEQIEKKLDIQVLMFGEIPKGMRFKQLFLDDAHAILEFTYCEKSIYFEEAKMPNTRGKAGMIVSDRKPCQEVYSFGLDKVIQIEESKLDNGLAEYSARIELNESYYYLSGIMEKEQFVTLVEELNNY